MFGFKRVQNDPFYNRRRFVLLLFIYVVVWGFVMAALRVAEVIDTTDLGILLGYVTPVSGLGFHHYFRSAGQDGK